MATTRALRAGDWILVATEQARACRAQNGVLSSFLGAQVGPPFTPGTFAFETFGWWNAAAGPVFVAAADEGKDVPKLALVDIPDTPAAPATSLFLTDVPGKVAAGTESAAVRQSALRIGVDLRVMLDAMGKGSNPGTRNLAGVLCLDATQSQRYWNAVVGLGREYSFLASSTSVPTLQYWDSVVEGAKDGLRNVGEAAGKAAAVAAEAAGEVIGAAGSGLLHGLGVVNAALLLGGAYVVGREVF